MNEFDPTYEPMNPYIETPQSGVGFLDFLRKLVTVSPSAWQWPERTQPAVPITPNPADPVLQWANWRAGQLTPEAVEESLLSGGPIGMSAPGSFAGVLRNPLKQTAVKYLHPQTGEEPTKVFHGTPHPYRDIDPAKADPHALYGPGGGGYWTESPEVAGGLITEGKAQRRFATREEAEAAPGRNHFVWKDDETGEYVTTVKEAVVEKKGYAQTVPRERIEDDTVRRHIVQEIDKPSAHWRTPGYLTDAERESVESWLHNFETGGGVPAHQGDLSLLHMFLGEQPYNIDVMKAAQRAGAGGAPNVRPAHLNIRNPFDIDAPADPKIKPPVPLPPDATNDDLYDALVKAKGSKTAANSYLASLGYDGITHMGGARAGTKPHRVWIAFKPEQVVNPFEYASGAKAETPLVTSSGRSMLTQ